MKDEKILRKALEENFPNESQQEISKMLKTLESSNYEGETTPYILEFRGIVLRVGVICKETNQYNYYDTDAGAELSELLRK